MGPWDATTCHYAAGNSHLEVLQWARANGCPWDAVTCHRAAEGGHLSVLQWARANGCEWGTYMCTAAAESGHLDVPTVGHHSKELPVECGDVHQRGKKWPSAGAAVDHRQRMCSALFIISLLRRLARLQRHKQMSKYFICVRPLQYLQV